MTGEAVAGGQEVVEIIATSGMVAGTVVGRGTGAEEAPARLETNLAGTGTTVWIGLRGRSIRRGTKIVVRAEVSGSLVLGISMRRTVD